MTDEVKNNVKLEEAVSRESWNDFVIKNGSSFLQSWEWGEFQAGTGKLTVRFHSCHPEFISGSQETLKQSCPVEILNQVQDDVCGVQCDKIDWAAQFIENKLPGVNKFYWHCPRGPVVVNGEITSPQPSPLKGEGAEDILPEFIEKVKEAAGENVIFFRLGPDWDLSNRQSLSAGGFSQLPYDIEPSQTQILDITKTEDELLAQMHEKWRYNIRLAERKGVQVKLLVSDTHNFEHYFNEFYRLVSEGTAERKNIRHYSKEYYRKQLEINNNPTQPPLNLRGGEIPPLNLRGGKGALKPVLFVAEYEGKVIAANIVVLFGNKATYLHGATCSEHREVMAPHLLQWEQIKYAKAHGCTEYDFWGIVNEQTLDKRGKSWEGFTRFKKGFGGREVNYVGCWDYSLDKKWYSLYRLVQKFRR